MTLQALRPHHDVAPQVKPRWRGRIHQLAAGPAWAAAGLAWTLPRRPVVRAALGPFATTTAALFTTSAGYHRGGLLAVDAAEGRRHLVAEADARRRRWKLADHVVGYCFGASSYTALALLALPRPWREGLVVTTWALAGLASVLKSRGLDVLSGPADRVQAVLTLAAVGVAPVLPRVLSRSEQAALWAGIAAYGAGGAVLTLRRPDPSPAVFGYHETAHASMLVGTAVHAALFVALARRRAGRP